MKNTKKSLLVSVLSLVLCVAMLLGTTYAWFTDSVTSGVNQIVAGNLDVELYHKGANDEEEAKVTSETDDLFQDVAKWEPGAYAYETFTVKNVGDLALKYKMALNVASFTSYNGHNLTEVLKVAVLDNVPTSRADITGGEALATWSLNGAATLYPANAGDGKASEKTFTVAIYWEPTDHDNDFNMNNGRPQPLSIEFGVNLVATQYTYEADSFGIDYDEAATIELVPVERVESAMAKAVAKSGEETVFKAAAAPSSEQKQTEVVFEAGALDDGEYQLKVNTENNLFTATSENGLAATIDLKLFDDEGILAETFKDSKTATITTYITKGLQGTITVKYTGTDGKAQPTNVTYDAATGRLSFKTNHFSEYTVSSDSVCYSKLNDTAYTTLADAAEAAKGKDVITLLKNVDANVTVDAGKDFILNLNGCTINGQKVSQSPAILNHGTLAITDASKAGTGKIMREDKYGDEDPYYVIDNHGTMTIEKISVYNETENSWGGASLIRNNNIMTINSGDYKNINYVVLKNESGTLTVNGGTFNSGTYIYTVQVYGTAVINGGIFNKMFKKETGASITLYGGTYTYGGTDMKYYAGADTFEVVKVNGESKIYQIFRKGAEPKKYDARVTSPTYVDVYYIGGIDAANAAMDATYTGYTVYFYTAPTTTKTLSFNWIYYAWFADGVTPTGFVADTGLELQATKDSSTGIIEYKGVVTEKTAVASITNETGTQYYPNVRDAVNAAQNGETVKVLKDYSYSSSTNVCSNFNGTTLTIDLNGHTLSNVNFVSQKNGKNQTITVIDSVGTGASDGYINNYIDNSNLVIKGGTYTNYVFAQKGTITIEGGTFRGDLAEKQYNSMGKSSNSGKLIIKGGTFSSDPTEFVPAGYKVTQTGNVWNVTADN